MSSPKDISPTIFAFVGDLLFRAKIREILGNRVAFFKDITALQNSDIGAASHLFVDLNSLKLPVSELLGAVFSTKFAGQLVCFASHVSDELIGEAKACGAHEVLPRSKFVVLLESMREQFGKLNS